MALLKMQLKLKNEDHDSEARYRLKNQVYATVELTDKFTAPSHAMISSATAAAA